VDDSDSQSQSSTPSMPPDYWDHVASALRCTTRLRYLSINVDGGGDTAQAWILNNCTFQLRTFHCELSWDTHLQTFLNTQRQLSDLYILDYKIDDSTTTTTSPIDSHSLPKLSILECTFMEAAMALAPGRPITKLKTCFSKSRLDEKRTEMKELFTTLRRARRHLRALDIADSSYTSEFSMELLTTTVNNFANSNHLRYIGTLALPIEGRERLQFYGALMRLPRLQCIELEVSDWDPVPNTTPALRALTYELRLYCPSVTRVIFVYDFDRVVMRAVGNTCFLDGDANSETLWRDV